MLAEKGTSTPFSSPILTATLFVKSVISESSKFLKKSLVVISKFVDIVVSTSPSAGENS